MALDSRDKRASAILVGLPIGRVLPGPDAAAENQGDRQQVALVYRGIDATAAVGVTHAGELAQLILAHFAEVRAITPTADPQVVLNAAITAARAARPIDVNASLRDYLQTAH